MSDGTNEDKKDLQSISQMNRLICNQFNNQALLLQKYLLFLN